jgi:hypothetical protein
MDTIKKCKMLGTTNYKFEYKLGRIEESTFSDNKRIFWFGNFHTSYVIECKINENIMTIKTRNSEYTFELLDGTTFEEFKLSTDEIRELEELCK